MMGSRVVVAVVAVVVVAAVVGLSGCVFYLDPQCNDQIRNGDETGLDCGGRCKRCNMTRTASLSIAWGPTG